MKKSLNYLILIFAMLFVFSYNLFALECKYSDGKLTASYVIYEGDGSVGRAIINGTMTSTDETSFQNKENDIENWDKIFDPELDHTLAKISYKGKDYYTFNKACPPYAIYVDRVGQQDFAVFTEKYINQFEAYGKSKQGYAILELIESIGGDEGGKGGVDSKDTGSSCLSYTDERSCKNSSKFACVWNETKYGSYCNTDNLSYISCGDIFDVPSQVPPITSFIVNFFKIATPILLVIVAVVSLLKALGSSKEEEIKKAQTSLVKKMIAAALVFFVVSIVQFVILKVADNNEVGNISGCFSCFLNNDCKSSTYYKTNVAGTYMCTYLNGSKTSKVCVDNK